MEANLISRPAFDVDMNSSDCATTVVPRGALTATACDRLADALMRALDQRANRIILDLREIEVIDLAGVYVMLVARLRASDQLTDLLRVRGSPAVQRVIDRVLGPFVYINADRTFACLRHRAAQLLGGRNG
jgi:anti-anti-sigma factor